MIGDVYSWPEIDRWQNRGRADEGRIQAWDESEGWWNGQASIGDRRGQSGLDRIGGRPSWIGSETGGAGKWGVNSVAGLNLIGKAGLESGGLQ